MSNELIIKPASETRWDCASFGEVMLRFDPGFGRVRNARSFQVWEGGGEYNVARAMRKCWGKRAAVVTALPKNDLGWLVEDLIMQGGVDMSHVVWRDFDGLGREYLRGAHEAAHGSPCFIDKLPVNFLYIGIIARALPQARIVHLVRDPLDAAWAIHKTLFASAYHWSCDLDQVARLALVALVVRVVLVRTRDDLAVQRVAHAALDQHGDRLVHLVAHDAAGQLVTGLLRRVLRRLVVHAWPAFCPMRVFTRAMPRRIATSNGAE